MELPPFIEQADYEKGFAAYYDKEVKPALADVEAKRLRLYEDYKHRKGIAIPVIIGVLTLGFGGAGFMLGQPVVKEVPGIIAGAAMFIGLILWLLWVQKPVREHRKRVKTTFMSHICAFFGDLKHRGEGAMTRKDILRVGIFPSYDRMSAEDFIEGTYKGNKLYMCELQLKQKRKTKNGHHYVTVFRGMVMIIGFPKSFKGKTILKRDAGWLNWMNGFGGLEKVALEDPEFESIFEVYSNDQLEARVLLTTAFMERLLSLARLRSKTKEAKPSVQCAFVENELIIAIPSRKNLFEPGPIDQSVLKHDDIHRFLAQMNEVFQLMGVLKLDRV